MVIWETLSCPNEICFWFTITLCVKSIRFKHKVYETHHITQSPTYISLSSPLSACGCTSSLDNSSSLKPGKPRHSMGQKSPIVLSSIVLLEWPANRTLSAFVFERISCADLFFFLHALWSPMWSKCPTCHHNKVKDSAVTVDNGQANMFHRLER